MLSKKKKVMSLVAGSMLLASAASAEVKFSGGAELDLFYKTNQTEAFDTNKARGGFGQEAAITLNIDGIHDVADNAVIKNVKWRLAQKVATDYRYDPFGAREAWIGTETTFGELRAGNQFSNMYLVLDGTPNGMNNFMGDFGAHEVQYGRAISYFSPVFEGFQLLAQYDLGGKKNRMAWDFNNSQNPVDAGITTSYAYEVLLNYDSTYFGANLGYYRGINSGTSDFAPNVFGGESNTDMGGFYGTNERTAEEYLARVTFKYEGFKLFTTFSHSVLEGRWNDDTFDFLDSANWNTRINKFDVGATYNFMEKHTVGLGYVQVFDSRFFDGESVLEDNKNGLNSFYGQYTYQFTDNISTFVQARYATLNTRGDSSLAPDGIADNAKNVARILIGTYISF
ncbi:MAG: porin [Alphaproteobacteria bacterium]|jgi:hypothetical protein|nr:porin [Alphaproteobacteria bacterium]